MNEVTLIGFVGKDVEVRYQQSGEPISNFSLATSESWKDKTSGERQERTEWHRVEVFGPAAKFCRDYVAKGTKLLVRGAIHYDEWTDKDGNKRNTTKIRVSGPRAFIEFAGPKKDERSVPERAKAATEKSLGVEPHPETGFQATDEDVPFLLLIAPLAGLLLRFVA